MNHMQHICVQFNAIISICKKFFHFNCKLRECSSGSHTRFMDTIAMGRKVILKNIQDVLEDLRGFMSGRNKYDVENTITIVCFIAI